MCISIGIQQNNLPPFVRIFALPMKTTFSAFYAWFTSSYTNTCSEICDNIQ